MKIDERGGKRYDPALFYFGPQGKPFNRRCLRLPRHHGDGTAVERIVYCDCNEGVHEPEYALKHFGKRLLKYYQELGAF